MSKQPDPQTTKSVTLIMAIAITLPTLLACAIFFSVPMAKFTWDYALMFWFGIPL